MENKSPKFLLKGGSVNFQAMKDILISINIFQKYIIHKKIEPWSIYIKN